MLTIILVFPQESARAPHPPSNSQTGKLWALAERVGALVSRRLFLKDGLKLNIDFIIINTISCKVSFYIRITTFDHLKAGFGAEI